MVSSFSFRNVGDACNLPAQGYQKTAGSASGSQQEQGLGKSPSRPSSLAHPFSLGIMATIRNVHYHEMALFRTSMQLEADIRHLASETLTRTISSKEVRF